MYEFWMRAEQFYATELPMVALVLLILAIVGLFIFYYTQKRSQKRKIIGTIFLTIFVGSIGYATWQHITYNHWLEQSAYVNPGVRNQREIMGSVVMEDTQIAAAYQGIDLREQYGQLEMYQVKSVRQEISNRYLGEREGRHYFTTGSEERYAFWYRGDVQFTTEQSYLEGISFQLTDDRFETLGFTAVTPNYLETIYINQEEADQAENEFPVEILPFSSAIANWIAP